MSLSITPYFGSATGDPVRSLRRAAWQSLDGMPATSGFVDFLHNGGPIALNPLRVERQIIRASAMQQASLPGKYDYALGPLNMGDLDAGNKMQLMAFLQVLQGYATSNPSTTHYRHRISQAQSSRQVNAITLLSDSDQGIPIRVADFRASGFTLNLTQRQNLTLTVPGVGGRFDFFGEVTLASGSGAVFPVVSNFSEYNWEESGDHVIFVKIISQTSTHVTFQIKRGTAGSYSANQTAEKSTSTVAKWYYITGYGASIANEERDKQLVIAFPAGTYVADDVFNVANRRSTWSPSFGTERVVAEVQARFVISDYVIPIDVGATLSVTVPGVKTRYGNTAMPVGSFRKGSQQVTLTINRTLADLTFQKAKMLRSNVACVIEAKNDLVLGSTPVKTGHLFVMPNLQMSGATFDVEAGGQNDQESVTLIAKEATSAYTYDGMNFTADLEVVADTGLATVAS